MGVIALVDNSAAVFCIFFVSVLVVISVVFTHTGGSVPMQPASLWVQCTMSGG